MAPRTAKAKKAADVKVAENEAPKKGRGKAKVIEDAEQEVPDIDIDEKPALIAEKKKRGKKANGTNGQEVTNGTAEEIVPPTKRGRKKAVEDPAPEEKSSNGDISAEESNPAEDEANGDVIEEIDDEKSAPIGRGRKKAVKPEKAKPKQTGRGRKAKLEADDEVEKDISEEKPKGKGRGRKAQPKPEAEPESEEKTESVEETNEPATKGKKKSGKSAKEKTPESDKEGSGEEQVDEKLEEPEENEKLEEPKKKETKGRKGQGKKAQAKEDKDDEEEEVKEEPASKKRKVNKKEDKGKGDSKDEDVEEEAAEAKPAKGKRGQKKVAETLEPEEPQDTGEPTSKRRRKPTEEKAPAEDSKKKAPAKNKATTDYEDIDFSNTSKNSQGKEWNFKIASWNVDGIRAWMSKGGLDYIKYEKPDILCLQEVKCAQDKLPDEVANLPGYHAYWLCSDKDGYAGVGIYTTKLAMSVQYGLQNEELDSEGRIITAEYEHFYLISTYVPNAGRKLVTLPKRLQWNEEFRKYVKELDKKKPVIICGDMNVAHNEIDLANPKTNKKNAGFTEEERSGMTDLLGDGFVDTFRHLNPEKTGAYTFWTYMSNSRAKNVGWRLDYFIVSERLMPSICDHVIRSDVYGSDHCPISMFLHLSTADKPKE